MKNRIVGGLFIWLLSLGSGVGAQELRILFVGNSLTYTNDLPAILSGLAKAEGQTITATSFCFPNYGLEDHWASGQLQALLATQQFDVLIAQQGPSSQADGLQSLIEYGGKISALCRQHGVRFGYLMVWPSVGYYGTFDGVIGNYEAAARQEQALLFPAGKIWKAYLQDHPPTDLYGPDLFHPSLEGSFLVALTIFRGAIS